MKFLFLPLTIAFFVYAESIDFVEKRHYKIVDIVQVYEGSVHHSAKELKIIYQKPKNITIIKNGDTVNIDNGNSKQSINLAERPELMPYFTLMENMIIGNSLFFEEFFTIRKNESECSLTPKDMLRKYIEDIVIAGNINSFTSFVLKLTNGDTIEFSKK